MKKEIEIPTLDGAQKTVVCLILGAFSLFFDAGLTSVSLPVFAEAFGGATSQVSSLALIWLGGLLALLLPTAWTRIRLGLDRLFGFGALLLLLGAIPGIFAPNLFFLSVCRLVQGAGAGILAAAGYIMVPVYLSRGRMAPVFRWLALAAGVGLLSGFLCGGALIDLLSWRGAYAFEALLLIVFVAVVRFWLPEDRSERPSDEPQPDVRGALLLGGTLLCALVSLSGGQEMGWLLALLPFAGAVGCFVALRRFGKMENLLGVVAMALLGERPFRRALLSFFLFFAALAGFWFLLPFSLQNVCGFSPTATGFMLLLGALFFAGGLALAQRLCLLAGDLLTALAGLLLAAGVASSLALFAPAKALLSVVLLIFLASGVWGVALFALSRRAFLLSPREWRFEALSLLSVGMTFGALAGISATDTLFALAHPRGMLKPYRDIHENYLDQGVEMAFFAVGALLVLTMLSLFGRNRQKAEPETKTKE